MKTIYLISCCKEKLDYPAPAEKLYQSTGFKKSLAYSRSQKPDAIYILSAKHHVVKLDDIIAPYDVCLSDQTPSYRRDWKNQVLKDLSEVSDLKKDKFVILATIDYYQDFISELSNYELPLKNLEHDEFINWYNMNTPKI